MKKLMCALVCGLMLVPLSAWGQGSGNELQSVTPPPSNSHPMKGNPYYSIPDYKYPQGAQSVTPPPANSNPMKGNPYHSIPDYRYPER